MKIKYILLFVSLIIFLSGISKVEAQEEKEPKERYIVQFYKKIDGNLVHESGGKIKNEIKIINSLVVELSSREAEKLRKNPKIKEVVKVKKGELSDATTEEINWGRNAIKSINANNTGLSGEKVKIAILDSGISPHEDLSYVDAESFVENETYEDVIGHGTHVAGIIAAKNNGITGITGVAPNSEIYSLKIFRPDRTTDEGYLLAALQWCIVHNINIINMSLHIESSDVLDEALQVARDNGILMVAAAGNGDKNSDYKGYNRINYPASNPNVIAVGNVNEQFIRNYGSNYGQGLDVVAPGTNICSTLPSNEIVIERYSCQGGELSTEKYGLMSGTSMSTPYVVGILALLKEKYPYDSSDELESKLKLTAINLGNDNGYDEEYGYGLVQAPNSEYTPSEKIMEKLPYTTIFDDVTDSIKMTDNNYKSGATFDVGKKIIYQFENLIKVKGFDLVLKEPQNENRNLTISLYGNNFQLIKTMTVANEGYFSISDIPDVRVKYVEIKNSGTENIEVSEFELTGNTSMDERNTGVFFNGYNQYGTASVNINPKDNNGNEYMPTVTVEFWVKPDRINYGNRQDILSQDDGGYDRSIIIESNSDKWGIFTGDGVWTPTTVDAKQWQHIAVTYTPNNIYFYKNGEKFDYNKETGKTPVNDRGHEFITIGKNYSYGEEFKGTISDMRIWDKALTPDELDKPTSSTSDSHLIARWDLDGANEAIGYEQIQQKNFTFYNEPKLYKEKLYVESNYSVDYDTSKADVQVKVGDIDNFGFGFNSDYDPFSGIETANNHDFPFEPESDDFDGTDRIMIPSSFDYNNPTGFIDGYATRTQGKDNTVRPIEMVYDLKGKSVNAAKIQMFVDDFQPADLLVNSHFTFNLNGIEIPSISHRINLLQQTGPKGVLLTFDIPEEYLYLLNSGIAKIEIDDTTTGVGDGYAIDFAQLLINPKLN